MEKDILVEYKDSTGVATARAKTWDEEGNFTLLYSDVSKDSLMLIIPTQNIIILRIVEPK